MAGPPARLGQLPTSPGMVSVILHTPLGVWIVDPFAPADPSVDRIMRMLGIDVELRLGPPNQDDLDSPKLSTGLVAAGGLLAILAWQMYRKVRR